MEENINDSNAPKYCPFCNSESLFMEIGFWSAKSHDDQDNRIVLAEYQCCECGESFWT